ncbi:MAG: enoyl-CoA hydratase/isomerase family protein [Planctomycetota bacterium]
MLRRETGPGYDILRLEHGKASALDLELCVALESAFAELAASPPPALLITGRDAIFCAGVDLLRLKTGGEGYVAEFLPALTRAIEAMVQLPMPVVAAVNGHAIAGGCILALAADHVVAAEGKGRIGVPELLVGVPFPRIGLELVRARAGDAATRRLTLTGAAVPFDEARTMGLVDDCVSPPELMAHAEGVALRLAAIPAVTFAVHKRQLRAPILALVGDGEVDRDVHAAWSRPEVLAAVDAFVQRTLRK